MTRAVTSAVEEAVAETAADLRGLDSALHARFADELPRAADTVARRLIAALQRERLGGVRAHDDTIHTPLGPVAARRYGFARAEPVGPLPGDPLEIVAELAAMVGAGTDLTAELGSAVANLALAAARRPTTDPFATAGPTAGLIAAGPDERAAAFERLVTDGHNLHPCARTRLGWGAADVLAHDLESGATAVGFVGVRRDLLIGDDLGARLGVAGTACHAAQPVHAWQLGHLRRTRPDLFAAGVLAECDAPTLPAVPTAALRTVHVAGRGYLKLALDVLVTSTRRTISVASSRNGPAISALIADLLAGEPVLLLAETAGAACSAAERDVTAILREGLAGPAGPPGSAGSAGRLAPGEIAVPAAALTVALPGRAGSVVGELVRSDDVSPPAFVRAYARLLLPPLLRLATRHGIALEAHLQNCLPVFRGGRPVRMVLRDVAGLRVHRPRLAARGHRLRLWPGSVVGTDDPEVLRAKLGYTVLQAHLGELIRHLADTAGLDEDAAWRDVRAVVDEVYAELRTDPTVAVDAAADHAFWTAPTMPHKALVRMRLAGDGDRYVPVSNPLRDRAP
jgi:siderophore synthetase component